MLIALSTRWPTTLGTWFWFPRLIWMVMVWSGATRVPADGFVPTAWPAELLLSTSVVEIDWKPAFCSVVRAASADWPATSGTATVCCLRPTTSDTAVLPETCWPGPGSEVITLPTWLESLVSRSVRPPTCRPAARSLDSASSGDRPSTLGTVTCAGPLPT